METVLKFGKWRMIFTVLVVEQLLKCTLFLNIRDIKGRLLKGRKFLRSKSRPRFLSKGIRSAAFQLSGTRPVTRDILTISVMEGTSASRQDFSSHVGTGSSWQDALVNSRMILGDVFNDTAEKWCNFSTAFTARSWGSSTWILLRSSLMSSIFAKRRKQTHLQAWWHCHAHRQARTERFLGQWVNHSEQFSRITRALINQIGIVVNACRFKVCGVLIAHQGLHTQWQLFQSLGRLVVHDRFLLNATAFAL